MNVTKLIDQSVALECGSKHSMSNDLSASIPLPILTFILSYNDDLWDIRVSELVCKRWRDASRKRTSIIGIGQMTIEHIKQYPQLSFIDIVSEEEENDWPRFFQLITAWKMVGQSEQFHLIFRLQTHEFNWVNDDPTMLCIEEAENFSMIWLEYDNGRFLMSVLEFVPQRILITSYCCLEERRNIVAFGSLLDSYNVSHSIDSLVYHANYFYKSDLATIKRWKAKRITIYIRNQGGQTVAEGQHDHVDIIYVKKS